MKMFTLWRELIPLVIILISALPTRAAYAELKEFDLTIAYKTVNYTGKSVKAMSINGSIPGPVLELTEGDRVRIRVHNEMDIETSIHWHGLLLPNREDGVPYLTTPPIRPGKAYIYQFPIKQAGTYWYHSHTGLQEQRGVYGGIVIHPKNKLIKADREYVLVLSDWTDEDPDEVMRTLKRGSEYYALKKGSVQSIAGAIKAGELDSVMKRSWSRMPPMDISDVGYDAFLVNGAPETSFKARPGETIRLRIINAAASTYFYLQFAGGPMQLISADGLDVRPVPQHRFLIAIAETYDVLISVPHDGAFEFRATAQDGSGHASAYFGAGRKVKAPDVPKPNLYMMHSGHDMASMKPEGQEQGHDSHEMPPVMDDQNKMESIQTGPAKNEMKPHAMPENGSMPDMKHKASEPSSGMLMENGTAPHDPSHKMDDRPLAPYDMLQAPTPTNLPHGRPWKTINLKVTGDMERYVWSFNGKTLLEADMIRIERGHNIRIVFDNETMMHHPIHLHGHFFRVVNRHGAHSPLKHTVDVPPLGKQVIEFHGSEDKDWFMHCHILYHMKAGMARVIHYKGSQVDDDIAEYRKEPNFLNHDSVFAWMDVSLLSQMTEGEIVLASTRHTFKAAWEVGWDEDEREFLGKYEYYADRFFSPLAGLLVDNEDVRGILGFRYRLPFNFESTVWADTDGEVRLSLDQEFQVTDRLALFGEVQYDSGHKWEWSAGAHFTINKQWALEIRHHSEYGFGGGLALHF